MKVLLVAGTPSEHAPGIASSTAHKDFAEDSYAYGIGLLAACVAADPRCEGVEVALADVPVPRGGGRLDGDLLERIVDARPDVVGLSCACWSLDAFVDLAPLIKARLPSTVVLLGGPSVSFEPEPILHRHPAVDLVVAGEGELPLVELCATRFRDPSTVPSLTRREGSAIRRSAPAPLVDLATLPSPYLDGVLAPPSGSLLIEPSRGCRYRCHYCSWSTRPGAIRDVPASRIRAELEWAMDRGYRSVNLCDTAINHDTGRLAELVGVLASVDPQGVLSKSVFLRHEDLDDAQLEILGRTPLAEVIIGVESIHAQVLRACGKPPLDRERFEARLAALGDAGHAVTVSIMSGLPADSVGGFRATLDYFEELLVKLPGVIERVVCFWLAVLPGTRFAAAAPRHGFEFAPRGTPYLTRSHDFSPRDLERAAELLIERTSRDPRFCAEEIHRAVAGAAERGHSEPSCPRLPWPTGEVRLGWQLESVRRLAEGDRYRFSRLGETTPALEVTVAKHVEGRAAFARTERHDVWYSVERPADGRRTAPHVEQLLVEVARLVGEAEQGDDP